MRAVDRRHNTALTMSCLPMLCPPKITPLAVLRNQDFEFDEFYILGCRLTPIGKADGQTRKPYAQR